MFKITYYTAVDAYLPALAAAYRRIGLEALTLKVYHRRGFTSAQMRHKLMEDLLDSDIFIVQLMGGKESMKDFETIMEACPLYVSVYLYGTTPAVAELGAIYNRIGSETAKNIFGYLSNGGAENLYQMLGFLCHTLGTSDVAKKMTFEKPKQLPMHGIYHPEYGFCPHLSAYLPRIQSHEMVIGVVFYRNYYLNDDCAVIDALIGSIESKGIGVIPIFLTTVKNEAIDNLAVSEILKKYCFDSDGTCRVNALINLIMFSNGKMGTCYASYLDAVDVPVLQGLLTTDPYEVWDHANYGLTPSALSLNVALPETDGCIIGVPIASKQLIRDDYTGIDIIRYEPIAERVDRLVRMAVRYARLSGLSNAQKKIAIIMHNYPPKNETIGCAYGLDTHASVIKILRALEYEGYSIERIYEDSNDLMTALLQGCTNYEAMCTEAQIGKTQKISESAYGTYYSQLSDRIQKEMEKHWGMPPGNCMTTDVDYEKELLIPGIINGNVFIGIQPKRSDLIETAQTYHDTELSVGHHYVGYYRWLKNVFGADAVIHMGKHGSLEWLPGKAVALSEHCQGDAVLEELPNFYPYIINNPGEGTQAKRRSSACLIGHLEPAMFQADLYDEFVMLEDLIENYIEDKRYGRSPSEAMVKNLEEAFNRCGLSNLLKDIKDLDKQVSKSHGYLEEMKETLINNGLHTLGEAPKDDALIDFIQALTRIDSPNAPSLRAALARGLGFQMDALYEGRSSQNIEVQRQAKEAFRAIDMCGKALIRLVVAGNYSAPALEGLCHQYKLKNYAEISALASQIQFELMPNLARTKDEIGNLIRGLEGRFVSPGPSGAPTRGHVDILPTGRNFYTLNPYALPTRTAWSNGVKAAEVLLDRYQRENGKMPTRVGFVLFGSPVIRTKGEDIAQIMYLIGVEPVWQPGSQTVKSFKVIPLETLGRPRIDVVIRITGFFRDAFQNVIEMLDRAFHTVADLDEAVEENAVKKHVLEMTESLEGKGMSKVESALRATGRIFGAKPGYYGTGVNTLVNSKDWSSSKDLAEMYLTYGSYQYGKHQYGVQDVEMLSKQLSRIDLAVKNIDTKETDVLANDDNYAYLGGMISAARILGNENVDGYVGDTSNPARISVKTIQEETKFVIQTKLLNPKWYEALKKHGYRGAMEISNAVDYVFGWDATTGSIDEQTYEKITAAFVENEAMTAWMHAVNPWSRQNIIERLLEAINRSLWAADDTMAQYLREQYLENESIFEE